MKLRKLSLRTRIFIAMILLVVLASVLVAFVAIYHYKGEREAYHADRLEQKEENIKTHISRVLNGRQNTWEVTTDNIPIIFKEELSNIADIHKLQINLYDLEGSLLIPSKANLKHDQKDKCIEAEILNTISNTASHRYVNKHVENGKTFQSSYSYINDSKFNPIAIINLPYLEDDDFLKDELNQFLMRLGYAYLFILIM